jgi:hypothetical protein
VARVRVVVVSFIRRAQTGPQACSGGGAGAAGANFLVVGGRWWGFAARTKK